VSFLSLSYFSSTLRAISSWLLFASIVENHGHEGRPANVFTMARRLSTKCLAIFSLLFLFLSLHASAQTTINHNFQTSVNSKTVSSTTISHNFDVSSPSPAATSAAGGSDDAAACEADAPKPLRTEAPYCEIRGNSDFYGLGVRLGIYFTWLTSWIANNFLADEMAGAFDTNSIFLLSLLITMLYFSITFRLNAVDGLVLLQLAWGFVFSVMSLWGYRTMYYRKEGPDGKKHFGGLGTHFRLLLMVSISAYSVWYWTEGLQDGLPRCAQAAREPCGGLKTFLFAKVDVYGPIRWLNLAGSVVCCVYYGIMVLAAMAAAMHRVINFIRNRKNEWELQQVDVTDDGLNRNE
jgi:hypothetical protein